MEENALADHLKKKHYTLIINGYEDKNKVVEGLINSGYVVGAKLEKDNLGRPQGWKVDVYE